MEHTVGLAVAGLRAPVSKMAEHPAEYLAKLKLKFQDTRAQIRAVMNMPYPADPLIEPELAGLTYYQVGLIRQAQLAGVGSLEALEFFTDRDIGKPAQVNANVNISAESYADFLKRIAVAEGEIIDVEPSKEDLGL